METYCLKKCLEDSTYVRAKIRDDVAKYLKSKKFLDAITELNNDINVDTTTYAEWTDNDGVDAIWFKLKDISGWIIFDIRSFMPKILFHNENGDNRTISFDYSFENPEINCWYTTIDCRKIESKVLLGESFPTDLIKTFRDKVKEIYKKHNTGERKEIRDDVLDILGRESFLGYLKNEASDILAMADEHYKLSGDLDCIEYSGRYERRCIERNVFIEFKNDVAMLKIVRDHCKCDCIEVKFDIEKLHSLLNDFDKKTPIFECHLLKKNSTGVISQQSLKMNMSGFSETHYDVVKQIIRIGRMLKNAYERIKPRYDKLYLNFLEAFYAKNFKKSENDLKKSYEQGHYHFRSCLRDIQEWAKEHEDTVDEHTANLKDGLFSNKSLSNFMEA